MKCAAILMSSNMLTVLPNAKSAERIDLPIDPNWSADKIAEMIGQVLKSNGGIDQLAVLGLESAQVLATTLRHQGGRSKQPAAMLYQVEEFLPLSAEEVVADFIVFRKDALAVVTELDRVEPIVTSCAKLGIQLRSIAATSLMALQGADPEIFNRGTPLVVWQLEDRLDCFILSGGKPRVWRNIPADGESLAREIRWLRHQYPEISECLGINLASEIAINSISKAHTIDADTAIRRVVSRIVAGRASSWIELKRHPLAEFDPLFAARGRLRALAASLVLLAAAIVFTLIVRIQQNELTASQFHERQTQVFQKALPGQRVPTGILSRLESEHRKLSALTGKVQGMPKLESAIHLLIRSILPLPSDIRVRILEARIDANGVHLDGEVREHSHADLIANALRKLGLDVAPPRTERLPEKGVSYVISGQIVSSDSKNSK